MKTIRRLLDAAGGAVVGLVLAWGLAQLAASASRTFTSIHGGGSGGAYLATDPEWGYQTAEKIRQNLDLFAYAGLTLDLGGSDDVGVVTGASTWQPVRGYRDYTINGDSLGGLTCNVVTYYRTSNTATAVNVRLRNTTDGNTPTGGTGSGSSLTTITKETLTPTFASGAKVYRLEVEGDATNPVLAYGYIWCNTIPS